MRQSQAPGARHSPLPPCSRAWRGGTRAPADARCSVRSAPLRPGASAAHRLPASPPYAPETRRLRRTYGAPLRRPRASRGVHGASGPASPAAAPPRKWTPAAGPGRPSPPHGAMQARRPLDLGRRRAGLRAAAAREASATPGATAAEPGSLAQGCAATEQASRAPEPNAVLSATNSENRVSPVLSHGCQGTPGLFPTMV